VSHHAKASSAGSTSGQGTSLGSFLRGARRIGSGGSAPRAIGALALCMFLSALFVSAASAAFTRQPTGTTFGPAGTGAGTFEGVRSLAVDPSSGSIYVLDSAEGGSLYKFNSNGEPANFSSVATNVIKGVAGAGEKETQVAVAPAGASGGTAGDIYIASFGSAVSVFNEAGTKLGELGQSAACGVAVGPTGEIYVGSFAGGSGPANLEKYTPSANPPTNADLSGQSPAEPGAICNVAAAPSGEIYAADYFEGKVIRLNSFSDSASTSIIPGGAAIAVDQTNSVLNIDRHNEIALYDNAGTPNGNFGSAQLLGSTAIAVSPTSAAAYAANGSTGRVEVYGPALITPDVQVTAPSSVTDSSAILQGAINPVGGPSATCQFEYVTRSAFESGGFESAEVAPCLPAGPFTGNTAQQVEAAISGLERATEYRVRLTATNGNGTSSSAARFATIASPFGPEAPLGPCPSNEVLRAGPGARLPDCRAYEEASPVDKNGTGVEGLASLLSASPDGSSVTYLSQAEALIPASRGGAQDFPVYLARLDGEGWSSQRLLPSQENGEVAQYLGASRDLRYAFVQAGNLTEGEGKALFEIDTVTGAATQITPHLTGTTRVYAFAGSNNDGSIVFFESQSTVPTAPSSPQPVPGVDNLYVWNRGRDEVSLAGVLPGVTPGPPVGGSFAGAYDWYSAESTAVGGALASMTVAAHHAISSSGQQVYFTSAGSGQLYLRRGIGGSSPSTVQVSVPEAGVTDPFAPLPAAFQEATPDGSKVFFTSQEKLTANATTGPEDEGTDLYRWDAATESLRDITPHAAEENGARVRGLLGISEDGTSGYFIARGVLAAGATVGSENLYRFSEDTTTHEITILFIASLNQAGKEEVDRRNISPVALFLFDYEKTSRVTSSGNVLLFSSTAPLTGYDNISNAASGGVDCNHFRCPELFRFSASTGSLDCISCDPTGELPRGAASLQTVFIETFLVPGVEAQSSLTQNLSSDGNRIFFETSDRLVAEDTNGVNGCRTYNENNVTGPAYCQDVYEWEAPGTGSCRAVEANEGCISLLSTGKSDRASYFTGASTNGDAAFIVTNSQLVPQDRDSLNDVYATRVNGGLPSQRTLSPPPCIGDSSCRGPLRAGPTGAGPGTASFSGPGNTHMRQRSSCRRGKKGTRSRCAAKNGGRKHRKGKKKARRHRGAVQQRTKPNLEVVR